MPRGHARPGDSRRSLEVMTLGATGDVFETLVESAVVGLAAADMQTRLLRVNAAYARLLGRPPEDLVGVSLADLVHADDLAAEQHRVELLMTGEAETLRSELRHVAPDGRVTWVLHGITLVRDTGGQPAWFAVSAQDITERRRAEEDLRAATEELAHRVMHDPLTGLPNRMLLRDRLTLAQARAQRSHSRVAMLFCDLDGFKAVNDLHGHGVGDFVLVEVARRLTGAVRPTDTVARLGGDEFVVLLDPAPDEQGVAVLAARVEAAVALPLSAEGTTLSPAVSVGWHLAPSHEEDGVPLPIEVLLRRADEAMYDVKRRRRAS
jgi:diguanylate cyclase (GGDEF)-like protein/PAS domain S-box-containing protein